MPRAEDEASAAGPDMLTARGPPAPRRTEDGRESPVGHPRRRRAATPLFLLSILLPLLLLSDNVLGQQPQRQSKQPTEARKPARPGRAKTVTDLFNTSSCALPPYRCPYPRIEFYLYTRSTQEEPEKLDLLKDAGPTLMETHFDAAHPTKIVIHGFGGGRKHSPSPDMRKAYFTRGEYNVIIVDYSSLVVEPCLSQIEWAPRFCALCIAQLIGWLDDAWRWSIRGLVTANRLKRQAPTASRWRDFDPHMDYSDDDEQGEMEASAPADDGDFGQRVVQLIGRTANGARGQGNGVGGVGGHSSGGNGLTSGRDGVTTSGDGVTRGRESFTRGRDSFTRGRDSFTRGRDSFTRERDGFTRGRDGFTRGRDSFTRGRDSVTRGRYSVTIGGEGTTRGRDSATRGRDGATIGGGGVTRGRGSLTTLGDEVTRDLDSVTRGRHVAMSAHEDGTVGNSARGNTLANLGGNSNGEDNAEGPIDARRNIHSVPRANALIHVKGGDDGGDKTSSEGSSRGTITAAPRRLRFVGSPPQGVHVIGYSVGAHIAGLIANYVGQKRIGRITGLDPTIIFYMGNNRSRDLDTTDALFVDVIHTGAGVLGQWGPNGHVDFYVNGGTSQPGCTGGIYETLACDHQKVTPYFIESITSEKGFWATPCSNLLLYLVGWCTTTDRSKLIKMGEDVPHSARGIYYLETNARRPYAKGLPSDVNRRKRRGRG